MNMKNTVSVASIFKKQQPRKAKEVDEKSQTTPSILKQTTGDALMCKPLTVKQQPHSRSPQNAGLRMSRNSSNMHHLAAVFRDTSDSYRCHLYESAALKIERTLNALVNSLYEGTLQTVSSENSKQDLQASPLKLSAPAKYERMAQKLYQPLSQYKLGLCRTNTQGGRERLVQTLEIRMLHYKDHIAKQTAEITQLQKDWEAIVSAIWKLGVSCLGETVMKDLLLTDNDALRASPSSWSTDAESTLFVPEQGTSPPLRRIHANKKRVTFEVLDLHSNPNVMSAPPFPEFLYQPSRYDTKAVPLVPSFGEPEINKLETNIEELGQVHIEDFRKIEQDQRAYWKKKTAQLATALAD
ncbi:hypothetical protein BKA66DRAFT_573715 [Pyrenochaeta sp. MPI-SDFR-AT-0127]|nr:hypothetical protein BKA66DRAFT_573715 [Pyrenochaeta sp. MPI-SDFR-AT-0127]